MNGDSERLAHVVPVVATPMRKAKQPGNLPKRTADTHIGQPAPCHS